MTTKIAIGWMNISLMCMCVSCPSVALYIYMQFLQELFDITKWRHFPTFEKGRNIRESDEYVIVSSMILDCFYSYFLFTLNHIANMKIDTSGFHCKHFQNIK